MACKTARAPEGRHHEPQKRKSRCLVRQHWTAAKTNSRSDNQAAVETTRRTLGDLSGLFKSFFRAQAGLVRPDDATAGKGLFMYSETSQRMAGMPCHLKASSKNVGHWRSGKFMRAQDYGYKAAPYGAADKEGRSYADSL